MSKKDKDSLYQPHKLSRIEIIGKNLNGKMHYFVVDCDKSYCDNCSNETCSLSDFLRINKEKATHFINEVYNYITKKEPHLKSMYVNKMDIIYYVLKKCSGHDSYYDFLFKGDKLMSIKYDDDQSIRKRAYI